MSTHPSLYPADGCGCDGHCPCHAVGPGRFLPDRFDGPTGHGVCLCRCHHEPYRSTWRAAFAGRQPQRRGAPRLTDRQMERSTVEDYVGSFDGGL